VLYYHYQSVSPWPLAAVPTFLFRARVFSNFLHLFSIKLIAELIFCISTQKQINHSTKNKCTCSKTFRIETKRPQQEISIHQPLISYIVHHH
jgi:hypothetical protein